MYNIYEYFKFGGGGMTDLLQKLNFQIFGNFRAMDILDILMVAYIIYLFIHLVKETRAEPLLKGILMIIVVMQLSKWLQLNTIYFVIRNAMQYGVIALLIVFQPELRRALEKIGHTWFGISSLSADDPSKTAHAVAEICKACKTLSKTHTGALIVIERETKLNDLIHAGIAIDSLVSSELLLNIFVVNTPLHDGAVIVRGDRIMAATCVLPLTKREDLSSELGTRHRAGIGMSEQADAVTVIVSEETGTISYTVNGHIYRRQTAESLEANLLRLLENDSAKKAVNPKKFLYKRGSSK